MLSKPLKIRFKKDKQPVKLIVMPPSYKIEQELKTAYAVAYRKCIQEGVATRPSMLKLMEKEGLWGADQEEELTNLTIEISLLETTLIRAKDEDIEEDEQKKLVIRLAGARSKIYELISIKTLPLEYTAEEISGDIQLDNFIALSTFVDDGGNSRLYFHSYKEFLRRRMDTDVLKIVEAVEEEIGKIGVDMIVNLPEHQWMINHDYMDKKGEFLAKAVEEDIEEEIVEKSGIKTSILVDELVKE